jgi:hypothetical protein
MDKLFSAVWNLIVPYLSERRRAKDHVCVTTNAVKYDAPHGAYNATVILVATCFMWQVVCHVADGTRSFVWKSLVRCCRWCTDEHQMVQVLSMVAVVYRGLHNNPGKYRSYT